MLVAKLTGRQILDSPYTIALQCDACCNPIAGEISNPPNIITLPACVLTSWACQITLVDRIITQLSSSIVQKHEERQLAAENLDLHDLPASRLDDLPLPLPQNGGPVGDLKAKICQRSELATIQAQRHLWTPRGFSLPMRGWTDQSKCRVLAMSSRKHDGWGSNAAAARIAIRMATAPM
jgi:hypothetical protein